MEDKIRIAQNGTNTTITVTNNIKELYMTFGQYRVETLKVIFKDEKEKAIDELKKAKEELIKSFIETFRKIDIDEKDC